VPWITPTWRSPTSSKTRSSTISSLCWCNSSELFFSMLA
jgi:hypothetical protein